MFPIRVPKRSNIFKEILRYSIKSSSQCKIFIYILKEICFFEVYNWALRYHLSSGISFSAYNDDGVVSIFRHYNNNFHSFLFFCKFHSNFLNINHYQENIGLHMIHSNMYSKRNFRGFTDFLFLCTWSGPKLFDVAGSWRKNIHRYLHIVYYTSTTTCLLLEKCWLRA